MSTRAGLQSLGEWCVAFGLLALAAVSAMSIGMFILPVAILALTLAGRRNRAWPEAPAGGLLGAGGVCLFIAYLHRSDSPCPTSSGAVLVRPGDYGSCGGFDPAPWLLLGVTLTLVGLLGYAALRRTPLGRTAI